MSTHLLTPRMAGVLERIQRAKRPPFHAMTPQQARVAYVTAAEVLDLPRAKLAAVHDIELTAFDGTPLAARRYRPSDTPRGTLLYLHGGGFTIGSLETHDSLCRQLALRSGGAVVALDYRLAPEHRFPAAVDDAWAALHSLVEHPSSWGLAKAPPAVGGDSAGGTLAAVCAILARDAGLPLALQLLFYPGVAADQEAPSHHRYAQGFVLERETIRWFFAHYLPAAACATDWRFAPLLAPDLDGVAPAWLGLAECDPLYDDGIA